MASCVLLVQVVLGQETGSARVITLNRPRQLNGISDRVVYLLAQFLEKWEKDDDAKLVIFKGGAGRAFSAGGDLKMFYEGKSGDTNTAFADDSCLEVVYRMYWLCYHIHTYKKTTVALVNGLVMGGAAAMVAPLKFAVVTEKTIFATPEASVGLHTDCSFSYIHSRLPGYLGEYLALTGARLNAKEMISAGLATHFISSEKLEELEKHLLNLDSGDESAVRAVIEEFSADVQPDEDSVLNKLSTINKCFSAETVEDIIKAFHALIVVCASFSVGLNTRFLTDEDSTVQPPPLPVLRPVQYTTSSVSRHDAEAKILLMISWWMATLWSLRVRRQGHAMWDHGGTAHVSRSSTAKDFTESTFLGPLAAGEAEGELGEAVLGGIVEDRAEGRGRDGVVRGEGEAAEEERRGGPQRGVGVGLVEGERIDAFEERGDLLAEVGDTAASVAAERVEMRERILRRRSPLRWEKQSGPSPAAA
ncbi:3-hydroxyisobutyryl-CoA hydrolase-like protein 5 [Panicum miliaceum]|uniref:3-hydroxyisobutyryl-CoA hydrolase n=1 Tax=Panicum miliaceum TaxID=4540 RepID=A0A3L6SHM2_PANMI|nr:3-hydroxyisobutyryl-CoA hydrolase-like protein 5 [Panicum miliaceum]